MTNLDQGVRYCLTCGWFLRLLGSPVFIIFKERRIYIDRETYEVKYGIWFGAQPNFTGPFGCTNKIED
jgi:hypothetical protein